MTDRVQELAIDMLARFDELTSKFNSLSAMVDARLATLEAALESPRAEPPATCPDCGHDWARHLGGGCFAAVPYDKRNPDGATVACGCATEPPQAATWPAPDCAAGEGEALPRIECAQCVSPATRIRVIWQGGDVNDIELCGLVCDQHGGNAQYIIGEPARHILAQIAREAARVRQGGAG